MIYTDEIINNPVKLSHYLIENRVENNIRACDMTAGNGKDSKFILDKKNRGGPLGCPEKIIR